MEIASEWKWEQNAYNKQFFLPNMSLILPFMSWKEVFATRKEVPTHDIESNASRDSAMAGSEVETLV